MTTEKPKGYDGRTYFTIDEMAKLLPSPARLMHEIGYRWWKVYYAAKAKNWPLTNYEINEIKELIEICMHTRPRYVQYMEPFLAHALKPVADAAADENWATFDAAFNSATKAANDSHVSAGKPLLKWKLPATPPPDMVMEP